MPETVGKKRRRRARAQQHRAEDVVVEEDEERPGVGQSSTLKIEELPIQRTAVADAPATNARRRAPAADASAAGARDATPAGSERQLARLIQLSENCHSGQTERSVV